MLDIVRFLLDTPAATLAPSEQPDLAAYIACLARFDGLAEPELAGPDPLAVTPQSAASGVFERGHVGLDAVAPGHAGRAVDPGHDGLGAVDPGHDGLGAVDLDHDGLGAVERGFVVRASSVMRALSSPIDRAAARGALADRIGHAFAGGYGVALTRLVPSSRALAAGKLASLCATEKGGGHPRAIETTLTSAADGSLRLSGTKTFATLASVVDDLLVVATTGPRGPHGSHGPRDEPDQRRNQLRLVHIPAAREGVRIETRPAFPIAPEIPHCIVELRDVYVDPSEVLEGDGYDDYLKPFRTVEDTYVIAAFLGHVVVCLRRSHNPTELIERALVSLIALRGLADESPSSAEVHIVLAGVLGAVRQLVGDIETVTVSWPDEVRARWHRDLPLLSIAEKARARRREVAWGTRG